VRGTVDGGVGGNNNRSNAASSSSSGSGQPSPPGTVEVPMHRRRRDPQRPGDLTLAQPGLVRQPEHFSDVSHGGSGPRHRYLAHKIGQSCPSEAVAHLPTDPTAPHPPSGYSKSSGTSAPLLRNSRFITPGTGAPFGSERVRHYVRRAQSRHGSRCRTRPARHQRDVAQRVGRTGRGSAPPCSVSARSVELDPLHVIPRSLTFLVEVVRDPVRRRSG
jgi:hypothetical protein